ncbi:MAG: sigma-70 family RNA polymerase sigma factor [Verrucomicrobiota bacterium]
MNALSDPQLLHAYAERRSEAAFAELVRRHIDLVHSAALRMVNDADLAKDVSQGVFVALAKNSGKLTDHPVLSGWLHLTTRNIAAQTVRTDVRRRNREKEVASMNAHPETDVPWEEIGPHLDAALGELSEPDRDAVLLRYFENKSAQEMAATLGISGEAAQKRVSRAVERLRDNFSKRGITAGIAGLSGVISVNAVQAAPVGLAASIPASVAIAASKAIAMTMLQKALVATAICASLGIAIYQTSRASRLEEQNQVLRQAFGGRSGSSTAKIDSAGHRLETEASPRAADHGGAGGFKVLASGGDPHSPGEVSLIAPAGRGITTGAAEVAKLTADERKTVDGILRATWKRVSDDFATRATLVKTESTPEVEISVFRIAARPDRGSGYIADLEHALDSTVGSAKRKILMGGFKSRIPLGGFGAFDVTLEFFNRGGRFGYRCLYADPDSGKKGREASGNFDSFIENFGDSFEIPATAESRTMHYR